MADDLKFFGYPASLPQTVPVCLRKTDVGAVAVSVPVTWEIEGEWDDPDGTQLLGRVDPLKAAEQLNSELQRRQTGALYDEGEDAVPTAPLRGRFEAMRAGGEINAYEVAARMGWTRTKQGSRVPDTDKVLDTLGITRECRTLPYDTACQLAAVMHIDPVEVGL